MREPRILRVVLSFSFCFVENRKYDDSSLTACFKPKRDNKITTIRQKPMT